ncbi:VOC family protein [Echinicola jeungdonensis]|uniref:VOC family protein n=1 Tax=Echinicola jeungdonensis TaxID=709343 RepID=A0ABV5J6C8_9BACT|nr:VOC family protein [Echinicola jeungdonensis]MDN3669816.1 VOC family protein [Echinicola jeungdonensis]
MQKITPCLWFDENAAEAVNFYISALKNSKKGKAAYYDNASYEASEKQKGNFLTQEFTLEGHNFLALNAGPQFKFNPSISFFVNCSSTAEVDELWQKLKENGSILMPLGQYPFSKRYGWLQDQFGLSWQIMEVGEEKATQKIIPNLLFVGDQYGKAEEAMEFYTGIFEDSNIGHIYRYEKEEAPDQEGKIKYADFHLANQEFIAMESALSHQFSFNEAVSFIVNCQTQKEIDFYWNKLSAFPDSEQCGWLKDKFGVSWQVVPTVLPELLNDPDKEKAEKAMQAMMQMKKLEIKKLKEAFNS